MVDPFMIMMMNNPDGQFHRDDPAAVQAANYLLSNSSGATRSNPMLEASTSRAYDPYFHKSARFLGADTGGPNSIRVEESIDCREPSNSRFFLMKNLDTALAISIYQNSTISSCQLDGHEVIVSQRSLSQRHDAWAQNIPNTNTDMSDRTSSTTNYRPHAINHRVQTFPWNSHVRGSELILSTSNNSSSILYELTSIDELISTVKLKTIYAQHQPFYFNLNDAKMKAPIDGHMMFVQCNGNFNRIQVQQTNLDCSCNKFASMSPQAFIRDIPVELISHNGLNPITLQPLDDANKINDDDLIICDAIYSLESTCPLDRLQVELQFQLRKLVVELRCTQYSSQASSTNQSADRVSSSTTTSKHVDIKPRNLSKTQASNQNKSQDVDTSSPQQSSYNHGSVCMNSFQEGSSAEVPDVKPVIADSVQSSDTSNQASHDNKRSTITSHNNNRIESKSIEPPSSANHNVTLRLRIRVTNFGVCIVPFQMSQYTLSYKFVW